MDPVTKFGSVATLLENLAINTVLEGKSLQIIIFNIK
jgi:hypothetical protein